MFSVLFSPFVCLDGIFSKVYVAEWPHLGSAAH